MAKTKPLTNTEVKSAKPKDKVYKLGDGNGLQLRVKPSGGKSWLLDYVKPFTSKRTSIGLGPYPAITLADARTLRDDARRLIAKGIDPKEYKDDLSRKQHESLNNTFEQVAANWFRVKKAEISEDYAQDVWRSLELHIFPYLGKHPISKITAPLTIDVIKPISAKGSLETVKRLTQRLNEVMNFAVNTGLIQANPLSGIKAAFQKPEKQHMPTLTPEQLPELMSALSYASIKLVTRCLIEWQLHTMTRPSEAASTEWTEIDLANMLWVIPAERMKMNREHTVPITKEAAKLLERLKPISGHREYVFPADRDPKRHTNEQTANAALKRMGFNGRLVAHGLRALASTTLNQHGFDGDVVEAALAHVDKNEVRRAYNRSDYIQRRRVMMDWWSNHIELASKGIISQPANELKED